MRRKGIHVASYRRAGRLARRGSTGLRAGAVILKPGGVMDWHSTRAREELLIALAGRVLVEVEAASSPPRRSRGSGRGRRGVALAAGTCAVLPRHTVHRVVNQSRTRAHYVYVTAPT